MNLSIARHAFAAVLVAFSCLAFAQAYPSKPVTFVIPFSPGGASDIVGRLVADSLSKELGQNFVVENRAGAAGDIAARWVIQQGRPDGHMLLLGQPSLATNPALRKEKMYDPVADFVPVASVGMMTNVIVLNPSVPIKSVRELIDYARRNPGKLTYASAGTGSTTHLSVELFKVATGVDLLHVPYKGSGLALPDLVAGRVDLMFDLLASALPHIKANRLHPLAVTATRRSATAPELPTVAEAGVPDYSFAAWFGVMAPAGTPRSVVDKLNAAISRVAASEAFTAGLARNGVEPAISSPHEFAKFFRSEVIKWERLARDTKLAGSL
jgi:tripartite-type tricarboxylate transporter receptor subunit TctC